MNTKELGKIFAVAMIILLLIPIIYTACNYTYQYATRNSASSSATSPVTPTVGP